MARPHYSVATAASVEPLTLEQASTHVRIDDNADLPYLEELIAVAREAINGLTGRVSIKSTFKVVAPSWHALITGHDDHQDIPARNLWSMPIMRAPLVSVESVKYYASGSESQTTVDSSEYRVITGTEPGIVQFINTPPSVEDRPDAVEINFTAGYTDACNIPPGLAHLQKMMVAQLYTNRMEVEYSSASKVAIQFEALLEQQKIGGWLG